MIGLGFLLLGALVVWTFGEWRYRAWLREDRRQRAIVNASWDAWCANAMRPRVERGPLGPWKAPL
jgi:hypothetical protein